MKIPLQVTGHGIALTSSIEYAIRRKAGKLAALCENIISCKVVVESPHRHHHKGGLYNVRIDMSVPGAELAVSREQHPNLYVAIRDSFTALRRQLLERQNKRQNKVKHLVVTDADAGELLV